MKRFKNILVALDTRYQEHPIVAEAVKIAANNKAALKLISVVPEFPWTVRISMQDHEHLRELIGQEQQGKLTAIAASIQDLGVNVETVVRKGKTSVEIIREVLNGRHDLLLGVAKGKDSRASGFFGNTGMGLLRQAPCPVWLVTPETSPQFQHVLGCVDPSTGDPLDAELNAKVYELTTSLSQRLGCRYTILHAWSIWNEQMLKNRMKEHEFAAMEQRSLQQVSQLLDNFLVKQGGSFQSNSVELVKGEAAAVIPKFAKEHGVDLVVMGTVARSGLAGFIMGNTAEQILRQLECSVLAIKPESFRCPIQP